MPSNDGLVVSCADLDVDLGAHFLHHLFFIAGFGGFSPMPNLKLANFATELSYNFFYSRRLIVGNCCDFVCYIHVLFSEAGPAIFGACGLKITCRVALPFELLIMPTGGGTDPPGPQRTASGVGCASVAPVVGQWHPVPPQ